MMGLGGCSWKEEQNGDAWIFDVEVKEILY